MHCYQQQGFCSLLWQTMMEIWSTTTQKEHSLCNETQVWTICLLHIIYQQYNYIMLETMTWKKDKNMINRSKKIHKELKNKGHHPIFHVLGDNYSWISTNHILSQETEIQIVKLQNHHFKMSNLVVKYSKVPLHCQLSTLDPHYLIQFWLKFIPKTEVVLNFLQHWTKR